MLRVLILHDNPLVLEALQRQARAARQWHVAATTRSAEALERIENDGVDVLVTDILMPDKDGVELIREVRARHPELLIVAMSGGGALVGLESLNLVRFLGADATLAKPFPFEELVALVRKLAA